MLMRFYTDADAAGVFQWFGYRPMSARDVERQWKEDGLINDSTGRLVVEVGGEYAGEVDWRAVGRTGAAEIGICLLPDHRGRGIGTRAQRSLVEYLFAVLPVHRVQAGTELGNVVEQRALERVGFRREGVLRSMYFRNGEYRDSHHFRPPAARVGAVRANVHRLTDIASFRMPGRMASDGWFRAPVGRSRRLSALRRVSRAGHFRWWRRRSWSLASWPQMHAWPCRRQHSLHRARWRA